ncbi:MAG: hypothetical protein JW818_07590 [Pirellulales bacterium]|nr:hypothetical protein [Pirellulales bacterium]
MPRIAAAVAVVAIVGVSIGINIVRFPVVLEMMGAPPQAVETAQPETTPEAVPSEPAVDLSRMAPPDLPDFAPTKTTPIPVPAVDPIAPVPPALAEVYRGVEPVGDPLPALIQTETTEQPSTSTEEPSWTTARADEPNASQVASSDHSVELETRWPAEDAPAMDYASKTSAAEPTFAASQTAWQAERLTEPVVWAKRPGKLITPKLVPVSTNSTVRRLPPVDQTLGEISRNLSDEPLPDYPNTGR